MSQDITETQALELNIVTMKSVHSQIIVDVGRFFNRNSDCIDSWSIIAVSASCQNSSVPAGTINVVNSARRQYSLWTVFLHEDRKER